MPFGSERLRYWGVGPTVSEPMIMIVGYRFIEMTLACAALIDAGDGEA
jgi:hypothetical protein